MTVQLFNGDCLEVLQGIPDASVDAVIADPPYGTTACKWDSVIPFAPMWEQLRRVAKPNAAIVLFAAQPFTSALVMSNPREYRHHWVWDKRRGVGHQVAKYRPMMRHEDIVAFGRSTLRYFPQMEQRDTIKRSRAYGRSSVAPLAYMDDQVREYTHRYPTSIIEVSNASQSGKVHPTQKPVALLAYLIRTYTNPGDTVLDFCMGSGTTGVAAGQEGRDFIGIEKDTEHGYFSIAQQRIATAQPPLVMAAD